MSQHRQQPQNEVENPTMKKLRSWTVSITPESCPISVSTRAIGLMLPEVTRYLDMCPGDGSGSDEDAEDNRIKAPLSAMYRVSLAQLETKVHIAKSKEECLFTPSNHGSPSLFDLNPLPFLTNIMNTIAFESYNARPLSMIINSIGHVKMNGLHYMPVFTKKVTPLNLRISNLREYCQKMANPNTAPEYRRIGYLLNPIPNAKWENESDLESVVLKNPDDIIAADYNMNSFLNDCREMFGYFGGVRAKKKLKYGPTINFQGLGNPGILASTHVVPGQSSRLDKSNNVRSYGEQIFWSREHLTPDSWSIGVLTLAGEVLTSIDSPCRSQMLAAEEHIGRWGIVSDVFLRNYS